MATAADLERIAFGIDPSLLMEELGFAPDPWQAELLRSEARRVLLLCSRQHGKSTTVACLGLQEALYRPDSLVICISPTLRQSGELFGKITRFYEALGKPVRSTTRNATTLFLANGSRVVSLPGSPDTVRAYSAATTILVDEAARIDDNLLAAVSPMLATTEGRLILLSTPAGARGLFYDYWIGGDPVWDRVKVTADRCPRISKEFLANELAAFGSRYVRQEYGCEFLMSFDQCFDVEDVDRAFVSNVDPMFPAEI